MLQQAKQRIDHLAIIVRSENFEAYVEKFSKILGVSFEDSIYAEDAGVRAALSWDSGLEIIAPLREEGRYWDRIQRFGEGCTVLVFGVDDIDEATARANNMGIATREWRFDPSYPWLRRFRSFRETKVEAFPPDFVMELTFSEIVPREPGDPEEMACALIEPLAS
ncbi:VOC family protein [Sphingobium fuliginis]|uniref:VOC domain-containing protein n=1 Tax=Sphingobium fuliginis (strain ATCC 27551) TaxID=336203 RepID=A0A292ZGH0_SPHSA|nr:VOC family protein [Sphingobium fuliginis]GAY22178.1 hypothetical protein SFOMI_2733 [Sphingobium fuliginis]